jgi:peptidyl-prolyl cis-trans isomerase C
MPRLLPLLLALALLTTACGQALGDPGAAAVVNGEEITIAELRPFVIDTTGVVSPITGQPQSEREASNQALSELALLTLLSQELDRLGGDRVTDEDVEAALAAAAEAAGGEEAFADQLEAQGVPRSRVWLDEAFGLTVDRLVEQFLEDIEIGEADVEFAYRTRYGLPLVSHILVGTEEEAQAVLDRIEGGEDFATVAQEVSLDPGSAPQGGALGPLQVGAFDPAFEEAALALDPGELSDPVETQFGWHVITTQAGEELTDDLRAQITEELRQQQVQAELGGLLQRLIDPAEVDVNPRFGTWDPAFGPDGSMGRVIEATDPLGELEPAPSLESPLDGTAPAVDPNAPADPTAPADPNAPASQ